MEGLIIFVILVVLGYAAGTMAEKRHYKSIMEREDATLSLPAVTLRNAFSATDVIQDTRLVTGSAVISLDYFKRLLAALRFLFGGEVKSYESLLDRARREAVLRMKDDAGVADMVVNVRLETSAIGKSADRGKSIGSIEALAYGTAVTIAKG